jgi:3,4-dihydroxy 2-butanone 4-phosphate synthase / GTP cyclohydrolase II
MSAASERFAAGEPVLIASAPERAAFVAVAAETIDAAALERLHELGRGITVLAMEDAIARRLALEPSATVGRARTELPFTPSINAASLTGDGWSLPDRALTMRVAASPDSGPADVLIPGHVHPVRIADEQFLRHGGPVAGSLELARFAGRHAAVALCAVVDRAGAPVGVRELLAQRRFSGLPAADANELRARVRARITRESAIECSLPARSGSFRAVAHGFPGDDEPLLALVHGDPSAAACALVYVHSGCVLGDLFGSLLCACRAKLDRALADITAIGAGVVLYRKADPSLAVECKGRRPIDASLAAGLLARIGVRRVQIEGGTAALSGRLRALGLEVEDRRPLVQAA